MKKKKKLQANRKQPIILMISIYFTGNLSCFIKSLESLNHDAFESQKIFCEGFIGGFVSVVPAGTTIALFVLAFHGSEEPQFLQKDVAKCLVSSGSNLPTNSLPVIHLKSSKATNIFEAKALPVNFLHLLQWQY